MAQMAVSGYVSDEQGEALIQAHVYDTLSQAGALSNTYGFFSISLKESQAALRFSYVGYRDTVIFISGQPARGLSVRLKPYQLQEVVVSSGAEGSSSRIRMSTVQLPIQQIERMPAIMGETDVLKALTFLPGVSGGIEGSSNIFVRGGTPDQNLILLDGAPVYNVNHLFGFLSLFNSDAVRNVELVKGGFPARYGGRLSSVLKIDMKEGNKDRIRKKLSLGVVSSRFMIDGPLSKDKRTSLLLAGRTSYLDLFTFPLRLQFNAEKGNQFFNYNFFDLNAKVNHAFNARHRLFLSFYGGSDSFIEKFREISAVERNRLRWGNRTATLRSAHQLGNKLFLNNSLVYSDFNYAITHRVTATETGAEKQFFLSQSGLQSLSFQQSLEYAPGAAHAIVVGVEANRFRFTPQRNEVQAEGDPEIFYENRLGAGSLSLFAEDEFILRSWLSLSAGLRWNTYLLKERSFTFLEPRLAARISFWKQWQLKASFSNMHQPIHLIANNSIGLPNDLWVPATAQTPPQQAQQWALSLHRHFTQWGLEASLEYYQKYSWGLIDYSERKDFISTLDTDWETVIERGGRGWSEGVELLLHKKAGRLNGLLAYTLSRHERQFANINLGRRYPFQYDRRHDFAFSLNYQLNKHWNIAANWVYHTGNAVTLPTARVPAPEYARTYTGKYLFTYTTRNAARLPAYHRADLGVSYARTKENGRTHEWRLGAYNLYNRRNVYYLQPTNNRVVGPDGYTIIDWDVAINERRLLSFLPYVSYTLEW